MRVAGWLGAILRAHDRVRPAMNKFFGSEHVKPLALPAGSASIAAQFGKSS